MSETETSSGRALNPKPAPAPRPSGIRGELSGRRNATDAFFFFFGGEILPPPPVIVNSPVWPLFVGLGVSKSTILTPTGVCIQQLFCWRQTREFTFKEEEEEEKNTAKGWPFQYWPGRRPSWWALVKPQQGAACGRAEEFKALRFDSSPRPLRSRRARAGSHRTGL